MASHCQLYIASSKTRRGVGLPNLRLYNLSCLLRQGIDWLLHRSSYSNYTLEATWVSPLNLSAVLHSPLKALPSHLRNNSLFRDTVIAWREVCRLIGAPSTISNHLPIQGNPMFPPGLENEAYLLWTSQGFHTSCFHSLPWHP